MHIPWLVVTRVALLPIAALPRFSAAHTGKAAKLTRELASRCHSRQDELLGGKAWLDAQRVPDFPGLLRTQGCLHASSSEHNRRADTTSVESAGLPGVSAVQQSCQPRYQTAWPAPSIRAAVLKPERVRVVVAGHVGMAEYAVQRHPQNSTAR